MPHIALNSDLPGIIGLMVHRPDTGGPLGDLANALLRAPSSLEPGERELIAAYVSRLNGTEFCASSHAAFAAAQLAGGRELVQDVLADPGTAPISGRLRALLDVAAEVQSAARPVSDRAIAAARGEGADDTDLHDTVLIAAAFCMYNRYVSGLATELPKDDEYYAQATRRIVTDGYRAGTPTGIQETAA
ncbi:MULTISPECIES: carboxymuconolactone decarboxylase family protein [Streptomyces]|uniref:carboxymuconolactone decarboxylase family protein n=1 Tax=Streptomyces TaxID=1883 RepID=UPI0004C89C08|nr:MULTISPECIES: carboxymuconolactone decarboxylase family protein [Streptomyces]MDX2918001.1 carboxymuconolactone decarboxylase family protein [Streptomyces sp. NE06-03C]MDX3607342.1 carboxymuconolactone decarboxylase family protein [Streptomyces sp. FL06-04B]MDX3734381.1 carboxymuconolactone decarboxylase family protein [Streptomyces sp. ID01-15D]